MKFILPGNVAIKNKKNGQFLSVKQGRLVMTETSQGKNSEWLWKSIKENEFWGVIIAGNSEYDLTPLPWLGVPSISNWQKGTIPVSLGFWGNNHRPLWRRSGNKIISSQAAYLAQDEFGKIIGLSSTNNDNRTWDLLELEIQG